MREDAKDSTKYVDAQTARVGFFGVACLVLTPTNVDVLDSNHQTFCGACKSVTQTRTHSDAPLDVTCM